tara:strand:- start:1353 stop:1622 length:270 start_codon:yes stop_codon:yes gene_type:complete
MVSREVVKEVKTLYGNLISVQGVYVKRAFTRKANLKLTYKNDYMIVPLSQLHKPIKTTMIPDKFIKDKMNKLYYYQWKPVDDKQRLIWE